MNYELKLNPLNEEFTISGIWIIKNIKKTIGLIKSDIFHFQKFDFQLSTDIPRLLCNKFNIKLNLFNIKNKILIFFQIEICNLIITNSIKTNIEMNITNS